MLDSCSIPLSFGPNLMRIPSVRVFPNPTQSILRVDLGYRANGVACYSIFDASGRRLAFSTASIDADRQFLEISVEELISGLYYLLIDIDQQIHVSKFIKEQ